MSAVDDVRKLLQDFLAPELRAISVRLDAVEARLTQQDTQRQQDKKDIEARLAQQNTQLDTRLTQQDTQRQRDKEDILRAIQTLTDYRSLAERLAQVESKIAQPHQ